MLRLIISSLLLLTITSSPLEFDITIKQQKNLEYKIYLEEEFDLSRVTSFLYSINLYIGYPQQRFEAVLDTGSFVTWVIDKSISNKEYTGSKYDSSKSVTYASLHKKMNIEYVKGKISGNIFKDAVSLVAGTPSVTPFKLLSVTNAEGFATTDYNGLIGLGRGYIGGDTSSSLVNYFKDDRKIDKNVFSLKSLSQQKGKFYLGDFHSDFNKANNGFAKCNTINSGEHGRFWTCRLSYILIGETNESNFYTNGIKLYEYAVLDSGSSAIKAPCTVLPHFQEYFKDLVAKGKCAWTDGNGKDTVLGCDITTNFDKLPPIYLVLNGYGLKLSVKQLMMNYQNMAYFFFIRFNCEFGYWLIGQPLFMNYHVLFNIDENYIGFQGKFENFRKFTTDDDIIPGGYARYIVIFMIIIVVIAVAVILYLRRKKREQESYQQRLLYRF
jgi:hypothetical protein